MPFIFLAFIGIPLIEIALFIEVGDRIGLWPTIAIVFITAIIGTSLVRAQGMQAWARANQSMTENRLPLEEVLTGISLLLAGAFLVTPGFFTDAIGISLLLPPVRKLIWMFLASRLQGRVHMQGHGFNNAHNPQGPQDMPDGVIDGEYEIIDDDQDQKTNDNHTKLPDDMNNKD